ncbi:MAG: hypothetical protein KGL95_02165 [Patescibacteria group bacterium]|nr:hypothetical protein [Patescibacteria group bacterium]
MKYPSDNFYEGHSLSNDLNHSGKDEFVLASKRLRGLGIPPTDKSIQLSLDVIQQIHQFIIKNGRKEQDAVQTYFDRQIMTGDVLPIDINLAQHTFEQIMQMVDPYVTAGIVGSSVLGFVIKMKKFVKKMRTKDIVDKQTKKIIEKMLKKEGDQILKKVVKLKTMNNKKISNDTRKIKKKTNPSKSVKRNKIKKR